MNAEGGNAPRQRMEGKTMALSNLYDWNAKGTVSACTSSCGTTDKPSACGAGDKPDEKPSACGAGDKPKEKTSACGAGGK